MTIGQEAPSSHPAPRGRGRGRGRGWGGRGRGAAARNRLAAAAGVGGVRLSGRQSKYPDDRSQAHWERAQELKSNFTSLGRAVKAAAIELAERTEEILREDRKAHEKIPEFKTVTSFLKDRLNDAKRIAEVRRSWDDRLAKHRKAAESAIAQEQYKRDIEEEQELFEDATIVKLDELERLHDNRGPFQLPNDDYAIKYINEYRVHNQNGYAEFKDGGKVLYPDLTRKLFTDIAGYTTANGMPAAAGPTRPHPMKRRATDQPEGQSPSKKAALSSYADYEAPLLMPRHAAGLLASLDDNDKRAGSADGVDQASALGTPADGMSPRPPDDDDGASAAAPSRPVSPSVREPGIPRGPFAPDQYGVRVINKRPNADYPPNNRILIPPSFEWDDIDIGFRDSANDPTRVATKAKRGKYLGTPNSNVHCYDRRIWTYDSTKLEGELDPELLAKHKLHPMGFWLKESVNDREEPKPRTSGQRPVVFVGPKGEVNHTSRSVWRVRTQKRADDVLRRQALQNAVRTYCEQNEIPLEEVEPTVEDRETYRQAKFGNAALPLESDLAESMNGTELFSDDAVVREAFATNVAMLLASASAGTPKAHRKNSQRREDESAVDATPSRSYDAIRDVFGATDSPQLNTPRQATSGLPSHNVLALAEDGQVPTAALSQLADAAEIHGEGEVASLQQPSAAVDEGGMAYPEPPFSSPPSGPRRGPLAPPSLMDAPGSYSHGHGHPAPAQSMHQTQPRSPSLSLTTSRIPHPPDAPQFPVNEYSRPPPLSLGHTYQEQVHQQPASYLQMPSTAAPVPPVLSQPATIAPRIPFSKAAGGPVPPSLPALRPPNLQEAPSQSMDRGYPGLQRPTLAPAGSPHLVSAGPARATQPHDLSPVEDATSFSDALIDPALVGLQQQQQPQESGPGRRRSTVMAPPIVPAYASPSGGSPYGLSHGHPAGPGYAQMRDYSPEPYRGPPPYGPPPPPPQEYQLIAPFGAPPPSAMQQPLYSPPMQLQSYGQQASLHRQSAYAMSPPPTMQLQPFPPPQLHPSQQQLAPQPIAPQPIAPAPPAPMPSATTHSPSFPGQSSFSVFSAVPTTASNGPPTTRSRANGSHAPATAPGPNLAPSQTSPTTLGPVGPPGSAAAAAAQQGGKYRELAPAPTPPHRANWPQSGQELRTVQYDFRENIKDYSAVEVPRSSGPTTIRGWTHNMLKKPRGTSNGVPLGAGVGGSHERPLGERVPPLQRDAAEKERRGSHGRDRREQSEAREAGEKDEEVD